MKKILLIDDSELFRSYLSSKLEGYGFEVSQAANGFDGIMKIRQSEFDLIIMDFYLSRNSSIEVLESKMKNPNAKQIPVVMASAKIDRDSLLQVTQFGVRKFFTKPIKIDALIKAVSELLNVKIEMDNTPCIIDANFNDQIIFVEVAQGLNRDKIEVLKFRLQELLELYKVREPKVLVIMSGLEIGPNDSLQLASLVSIIQDNSGARPSNIKILTSSNFVKDFLKNRAVYAGIETVDSLDHAMDKLLGAKAEGFIDSGSGTVSENFLKPSAASVGSGQGVVNLNFEEDSRQTDTASNLKQLGSSVSIAIVDDDFVIREIIKKAFGDTGMHLTTFNDGEDFVTNDKVADFDLVFLDLMMPRLDGFQVLEALKKKNINVPVIVLSALSQRETVVKALGFGVRSYLIKPVQAEAVCQKAVEVLRMNF